MKKYLSIIFPLAIMAFFSSCNSDRKNAGSYTTEKISYKEVTYLTGDTASSPKQEIDILLYDIKTELSDAGQNITRAVSQTILDAEMGSIDAMCREYIETKKREYTGLLPEGLTIEEAGEEYFWLRCDHTYSIDSEVIAGYKGYINYVISFFEFAGGAHPSSWCTILNFDPKNGQEIVPDDFMKGNYESVLLPFIKAGIAKHFEKETFEEVVQEGLLFEEEIPLASNFIIGAEEITFVYNRYEIAPYAAGEIPVSIPLKEIEEILK